MPRVTFTQHLSRHVTSPELKVAGDTVAQMLENVFVENPRLRGYLLDDNGELRKHVNIFIDGETIRDRQKLSDAVSPRGEVFVLQALSGG